MASTADEGGSVVSTKRYAVIYGHWWDGHFWCGDLSETGGRLTAQWRAGYGDGDRLDDVTESGSQIHCFDGWKRRGLELAACAPGPGDSWRGW